MRKTKSLKLKAKNFLGFTLIELLIVVAVIGLLATIGLMAFTGQQKSAGDAQRKSDLQQYKIALENYANANNSAYPTSGGSSLTTQALCTIPEDPLANYMSGCPQDPNLAATGYTYQSDSDGTKWVLWAGLERSSNNWVVCSNGKSGEKLTAGFSVSGGSCPL